MLSHVIGAIAGISLLANAECLEGPFALVSPGVANSSAIVGKFVALRDFCFSWPAFSALRFLTISLVDLYRCALILREECGIIFALVLFIRVYFAFEVGVLP